MRFQVLGPVEVFTDDGEAVTPRALKVRSLLALLLLNANRPVAPQRIVAALWSGAPPRTVTTAIQVYMSKLRRHLERGEGACITTVSSGYLLRVQPQRLDLSEFDALTRTGRRAADEGRYREAGLLLSRALRMWHGPALADVRGTPTLEGHARQLDEQRHSVHERWLETELALGRHAQLIGELYGLVEAHPMWENLYACLMIALYRSGRVSECLAAFHTVRRQLDEELGMEPCARLRDLHRAVLAREEWLDDPGRTQPAGQAR